MASKLMSEQEAIERFVKDGDKIFVGHSTTTAFGLAREVVRQRKRNLTTVGTGHTLAGILLAVNGCAPRAITSYLGGALWPGLIHEMIRSGELQWEDYTNQTIMLMLMAGALGIPFIPTRSLLGSDYLREENLPQPGGFLGDKKLKVMSSPFDGKPVVALPAIKLDACLAHVQWADKEGNAVYWGPLSEEKWGPWAAERVIISADEIVPTEVIRSDPHRVTFPGIRVSAVVHMPWGALPTPLPGYYRHAAQFTREFSDSLLSREASAAFAEEWVYGCPTHEDFCAHCRKRFGDDVLKKLRMNVRQEPVRNIWYGYDAEPI